MNHRTYIPAINRGERERHESHPIGGRGQPRNPLCSLSKIKMHFLVALLMAVTIPSPCQSPAAVKDQISQHSHNAERYLREGRPDLAIPEFEKIVALDPGAVDAHANLGVLLFFRGDYKEAVPQLRAAVKLQPDLSKIQALLGLAEGRTGDQTGSRKDLEAVFPKLKDEKVYTEVGEALIQNYTATGDLEKAATTVSSLLALQPTNTVLLYSAYRLYSDLAGKAMLTLAMTAPGSAQMYMVMARELARHNEGALAIENYRKAIKSDPTLPGLHTELGDVLYHSSDEKLQAEAEAEFKAALAANPEDEKALLMLGKIAEKRGNLQAASTAYSHALALDPNDSDACTELGEVLVLLNQRERAQQMFERAIQIDPSDYVAHYRLAGLYRQSGKLNEAKEQVALCLKYKQMRDNLGKIFDSMRVLSRQHESEDDAKGIQ